MNTLDQLGYHSESFEDPKKIDEWLTLYSKDRRKVEIIGYSAFGVGDLRNHTEFTAGVYITILVKP